MPRKPRTEAQKVARRAAGYQYGSKDPDYNEAKSAFNKHIHRHHKGELVPSGTLEARISQHDDLHFLSGADHKHEPLGENETIFEYAHRCLVEGESHHGETDTTRSARQAAPVDSREGDG